MYILLVEDNQNAANALAQFLRAAGYRVQTCANADEALEACSRQLFSLLLCDISLPDGDGWTLLEKLRQKCRAGPAIAITAFGDPDDRRRSLEAGFAAHVTKPIDPDGLLAVIKWVMGTRDM